MSAAKQIRQVMETAGLSIDEFAERLGEKPHRIKDVLREKQRAPEDLLIKLVEIFGVDANWLLMASTPALTAEQERAHYVVAVLSPAEVEGLEKLRRGGFLPAVQQTISGNSNQVVGINNGSVANGSQAGGKRRR